MSKIFHIFGASEYFGGFIKRSDEFVIAADGGLKTLEKIGVKPDFTVGDFDSCAMPEDKTNVKLLPKIKDDTDTLSAIRSAIEMGAEEVHIWGASGGKREDHTFANYQCLAYLSERGIRAYLHTKDGFVTAITSGEFIPPVKEHGFISVFSLTSTCEGVTIKGLRYELEDAKLDCSFPLGVSNEYIGKESFISVKKGTLLVFC